MSNLEANRLELRGDLSGLTRLAGWIEAGAQHELSADTSFAVQLCLEEAVVNIIMHGGAKDDRVEIAIELERDGAMLVARIEDTGCEFRSDSISALIDGEVARGRKNRRLWHPPDAQLCQ